MADRRLARVFVWKEGAAPDPAYVQQVLGAAAPEARAPGAAVLVSSAGVAGDWPEDFWSYALPRLREATDWTDPARYELAGWAGNDARSGSRLFVVSVFEQARAARVAPAPTIAPAGPDPVAAGDAPSDATDAPAPTGLPPAIGLGHGAPPAGFPAGSVAPAGPAPRPAALPGYAPGGAPPAAYGPPAYGAVPVPSYPPPQYAPPRAPAPGYILPAGYPAAPPTSRPPAAPGYPPPYPAAATYTYSAPAYPAPLPAPPADAYPNQTGITAAELGDTYGGYYADFGPRFVAGLVDLVLISMLEWGIVLVALSVGRRFPDGAALLSCLAVAAGLIVLVIYLADFWAWRGQTPGMMMMGLRVVAANGAKPGFGRALLRALGYLMSLLTLGIGFLLILGDERRQGLQDRVADTFVVPVHPPPGPLPADLPGYAPVEPGAVAPPDPAPTPAALLSSGPALSSSPAPSPALPALPAPAVAGAGAGPLVPVPGATDDTAAAAFRRGLALLDEGVREPGGGQALMIVEPEAAQAAGAALRAAAEAAPDSGLYRYFVGVARRYGEGYAAAQPEFARAQQIEPGYWDATMQLYFGAQWHDAFAYPAWAARAGTLPGVLRAALPERPGSRLVVLREGAARTVAVLSHTRRDSWKRPLTADLPARIELVPSTTPSGLIVAVYVAVRDDPQNPYRGETFVNPAELPGPEADATQLGQNLVLQLARQRHTYLIFADETGALLLNRRLMFDPPTLDNLAQTATLVQNAAYQATTQGQAMALPQFQEAARWHIQQFPLERVLV